jgi:hypothetical protein
MSEADMLSATKILSLAYVIVFSLNIAVDYQNNYLVPWSPPTEEGMREIEWIVNAYGYGNDSVIIVVREHNIFLWMLAQTGGFIYFGNLLYLLANKIEEKLLNSSDLVTRNAYIGARQRLWIDGVLENFNPNRYTIVVTEHTYAPDFIELQLLEPIHKGIYLVKKMSEQEIERWFNFWNEIKTSNDLVKAAKNILVTSVLDAGDTAENWFSWTPQVTIDIDPIIKKVGSGSIKVRMNLDGSTPLYVACENRVSSWNFSNEGFIGFYFMSNITLEQDVWLVIVLDVERAVFKSYYAYAVMDKLESDTWHGLVISLNEFNSRGSPTLSSIRSIAFGISSTRPISIEIHIDEVFVGHI